MTTALHHASLVALFANTLHIKVRDHGAHKLPNCTSSQNADWMPSSQRSPASQTEQHSFLAPNRTCLQKPSSKLSDAGQAQVNSPWLTSIHDAAESLFSNREDHWRLEPRSHLVHPSQENSLQPNMVPRTAQQLPPLGFDLDAQAHQSTANAASHASLHDFGYANDPDRVDKGSHPEIHRSVGPLEWPRKFPLLSYGTQVLDSIPEFLLPAIRDVAPPDASRKLVRDVGLLDASSQIGRDAAPPDPSILMVADIATPEPLPQFAMATPEPLPQFDMATPEFLRNLVRQVTPEPFKHTPKKNTGEPIKHATTESTSKLGQLAHPRGKAPAVCTLHRYTLQELKSLIVERLNDKDFLKLVLQVDNLLG